MSIAPCTRVCLFHLKTLIVQSKSFFVITLCFKLFNIWTSQLRFRATISKDIKDESFMCMNNVQSLESQGTIVEATILFCLNLSSSHGNFQFILELSKLVKLLDLEVQDEDHYVEE